MENIELRKFKNLLTYFVSHLEWCESESSHSRGYEKYLKSYVESGQFKKAGQGYSGDKIQDQIKIWEDYQSGKICINVQSSFGSYKKRNSYLNWKDTGLNILAKWDDNRISSLFQEHYLYWEDDKRRLKIYKEVSIADLALFDDDEVITEELINFFNNFCREHKQLKAIGKQNGVHKMLEHYKNLLKYKNQIILQGPPGTGKTRLAKKIAEEIIGLPALRIKPSTLTDKLIIETLKDVAIIQSVARDTDYKLVRVDEIKQEVILEKTTGTQGSTSFSNIKKFYHNKSFEQAFSDNTRRRAGAIAKYIYDNVAEETINSNIEESEQFKLVQFHPSYTYEDFVRGIVVKPNPDGEGVLYKVENKIIGKFAEEALKNYLNSKKGGLTLAKENWVDEQFIKYAEEIELNLDLIDDYKVTDKVDLVEVEDEAFRYRGANGGWKVAQRMYFKDIKQAYIDGDVERQDIKKNQNLSASAKQHASYYIRIVNDFREFLERKNLSYHEDSVVSVVEKKYILVIDEINRANLSSVLGELIYSLEYRGEGLDCMYGDDEGENRINRKIILPPNLYIIGTMNTADRSVGHIDYAIRRRFAFVDVLPKDLSGYPSVVFYSDLFKAVSELFVKDYDTYVERGVLERADTLSSEFRPEDVWLGHSYFIEKEGADKKMRYQYEILPILKEYFKDGVLIGNEKVIFQELERIATE